MMLSNLRLQRNIVHHVFYKQPTSRSTTGILFQHNPTITRPFSSGPLLRSGLTKRLGTTLTTQVKLSTQITRKFSIISKTRLKNRPFWFVVVGMTSLFSYFSWTEFNSYGENAEVLQYIQSTNDLTELAEYWLAVYNSLYYYSSWEPLLKGGVVQLAMQQLKELYDLVPFSEATRVQLERKKQKLTPGSQEHMDVSNQLYMFYATVKVVEKISLALARLCEIELVADYIVQLGGIELITDFTLFGIDNFYMGDLWNAILKHKSLHEQILARDGFIDRLQALASAKDPPFAIRQVYNTLWPMMRNPEMREKILANEQIVNIITNFSPAIDDGFHKFFKDIYTMPVSIWDMHTRVPKRQIHFKEKKDLRNEVLKLVIYSTLGMIYCGIRWKRTLPNMANTLLVRKMATAFVGLATGDIIYTFADYHSFEGPAAREELNNSKMFTESGPSKFYYFHRTISDVSSKASLLIFFISYYNCKFVLLPAVAMFFASMFTIPNKKDIKNGKYVKYHWED